MKKPFSILVAIALLATIAISSCKSHGCPGVPETSKSFKSKSKGYAY